MKTFEEVKHLLDEDMKETLMEIGFNYYQTLKKGEGVDSE